MELHGFPADVFRQGDQIHGVEPAAPVGIAGTTLPLFYPDKPFLAGFHFYMKIIPYLGIMSTDKKSLFSVKKTQRRKLPASAEDIPAQQSRAGIRFDRLISY